MTINYKKILRITLYAFFYPIGIIALCAAALFIIQHRQSLSSTISRKPETFTELYFENNEKLPTKVINTDKLAYINPFFSSYTFQFTIRNLENKNMNYSYEVTTVSKTQSLIDSDTVIIKKNESKTITETFILPKKFSRTEIVVSILGKNQKISFWMGEEK